MILVLASNNPGKLREFHEILEPLGIGIVSQSMVGADFSVNETGVTYEENAYLKASSAVSFAQNFAVVADDSGLSVKALDGAPGIYSARFGGEECKTDEERCSYLLKKMEGVEDRSASFICSICCILPDGKIIRTRGECPGRLLTEPKGCNGFGYDPIFVPEGYTETFASLDQSVKNEISHRALALKAFREELEKYAY